MMIALRFEHLSTKVKMEYKSQAHIMKEQKKNEFNTLSKRQTKEGHKKGATRKDCLQVARND